MKITIENNIESNKYKYCLIWQGNGTIEDPEYCVANFSNKKHAIKILNFLVWYQKRFGDFDNINDCAVRLANACSQSKISYV
ncbi:MAG: hypothetical protein HGA42_14905 [Nostocales cyanobacterium W4_Combined_metabat2_030]|jgi:hypothetical protein|nr:hypothetical protein [Nostocales cyanobacterium W4_Combined_metabat2_030]